MSTTFGVKLEGENEVIKIAFRYYGGKIDGVRVKWYNPLYKLLPDSLKIIPLDNTSQGVKTIGDLKKL